MTKTATPWVQGRGLERLLALETNISDLLQFLSDCDTRPWLDVIGFMPAEVARESRHANHADLWLSSTAGAAVIEVKLAHLMSPTQQQAYEALEPRPQLFLAALGLDEDRVVEAMGDWRFLRLCDLVARWETCSDELARLLAKRAADILRHWDAQTAGVFVRDGENELPLMELEQKFLTRVVSRRVAALIRAQGLTAAAGVTNGGGLALVQAWVPVRGAGGDRCFMAEVRWWETKPGVELRFGVDFDLRPGQVEDEEVRRSAYNLAHEMGSFIDHDSLVAGLQDTQPRLAGLLRRDRASRPRAKGDWDAVITHGLEGARLADGRKNTRRSTTPAFYGDGALRFQAITEVNVNEASADDLVELIVATLNHLAVNQP